MSGAGFPAASQTGSLTHDTGMVLTTWLTVAASLAVVVTLILLSRHGLKFLEPYLMKGRRPRDLALVESLSIDQRRRLSVIRYGRKTGLILTGGSSDVFLGWTDADDGFPPLPPSGKPQTD